MAAVTSFGLLIWIKLTILCVLYIKTTSSSSSITRGRSESQARMQCLAGCLNTFKNKVSNKTKEKLGIDPGLVAFECGRKRSNGSSLDENRDFCQICQRTCISYTVSKKLQLKPLACQTFCQKKQLHMAICLPTCSHLEKLLLTNPGECPSSPEADVCETARRSCNFGDDRNCYGVKVQRCCPISSCGHVCTTANISLENIPPISKIPILTNVVFLNKFELDSRDDGDCDEPSIVANEHLQLLNVTWEKYPLQIVNEAVVFLLQVRSQIGAEFEPGKMSTQIWSDVAYTSRLFMPLESLKVGYWFQFRVAAISAGGTRGYSNASCPLQLETKPQPPSPPLHFREETMQLYDSKVNVQVRWNEPARSDLPITKYYLRWTKHYVLGGSKMESVTKYRTSIQPNSREHFLNKLDADSTYKIQISAVANYGNVNLRSQRATLFIKTPLVPSAEPFLNSKIYPTLSSKLNDCLCGDTQSGPLFTHQPFWEHDQLKVQVILKHSTLSVPRQTSRKYSSKHYDEADEAISKYVLEWIQKVCIDSGGSQTLNTADGMTQRITLRRQNRFVIGNLHFNCHYVMKLKGLTETGKTLHQWNACFCTDSCKKSKVAPGNRSPTCSKEVEVGILPPPVNVRAVVMSADPRNAATTTAYKALISWSTPQTSHPFIGFRLTWGQRVQEKVPISSYKDNGLQPRIDPMSANARIINSKDQSSILTHLKENTIYVVQIQTLSSFGDSSVSEIFFETPAARSWLQAATPIPNIHARSIASSNHSCQSYPHIFKAVMFLMLLLPNCLTKALT